MHEGFGDKQESSKFSSYISSRTGTIHFTTIKYSFYIQVYNSNHMICIVGCMYTNNKKKHSTFDYIKREVMI